MSDLQVFISYSSVDKEWARSFAEALKQRGVSIWLDQFEIGVGESLPNALEVGLRESDVLVAVIDPGASLRPASLFELGAAIGMGKRVVPIVPRELDPSKLPFELRTRRYLVRDSPEETAGELADSLEAA